MHVIGVRQAVAPVVQMSGLRRLLEWCTKARKVVVTFHRVYREPAELAPFDSCPAVSIGFFRQCLHYFHQRFEVVGLAELMNATPESKLPKLAVTFDDGWLDNYQNAFEVLQEYDLPATIFMTAGKLASAQPFWQQRLGKYFERAQAQPGGALDRSLRDIVGIRTLERLSVARFMEVVVSWKSLIPEQIDASLEELGHACPEANDSKRCFLNEDELREMARNNVAIGSHTMTHPILTRLAPERVDWELRASKAALEKTLGAPVELLAYPNGAYTQAISEQAGEIGYRFACTTHEGTVKQNTVPTMVPRIDMGWDRFTYRSGSFAASLFQIDLVRVGWA